MIATRVVEEGRVSWRRSRNNRKATGKEAGSIGELEKSIFSVQRDAGSAEVQRRAQVARRAIASRKGKTLLSARRYLPHEILEDAETKNETGVLGEQGGLSTHSLSTKGDSDVENWKKPTPLRKSQTRR